MKHPGAARPGVARPGVAAKRRGLAALAVALALAPAVLPGKGPTQPSDPPGLGPRLMGPVATLAAGVLWIRAERAFGHGREELGLARADLALALDPGATGGWSLLAEHQALDLASPTREPDPARRRAWFRSARATLERGAGSAREPAELRVLDGLLCAFAAARDPDLGWPGGEAALWDAAAVAFEAAEALGHPQARELAERARDAAAEPPR